VGVEKERPEVRKVGDWGKGKRMVREMTKGFGEGERRACLFFLFFSSYETIEEEEGTGD
jgi:hypothetical protein